MSKLICVVLCSLAFSTVAYADEAVVSCNINYVSPDGATTVNIVNQQYRIPIAHGVRYGQTVLLGERRLDISAEDVASEGWRTVTIQLWQSLNGGRYLCSETKNSQGAADCDFRSHSNQEMAQISCSRLR